MPRDEFHDLRPRCGNFGYAVMAFVLLATIAVLSAPL